MACCGKSDTDMTKLVLGFKSRKKNATAEVLYLGTDGNEARAKLMDPGEGFLRTELSYPMAAKTRHFQTAEEIEAAAKAKAEAEAAAAKVAEERAKLKAEAAAGDEPAADEPAVEEPAVEEPAKKQGKKK
jgi:hypothetical protein